MDRIKIYQQHVQQLLSKYAEYQPAYGEIEVETIFDVERNHYQVVHIGWHQQRWVHSCIIHIDIKNDKIWIQWNATEADIASELVELGVPKQDIVLGFQPPFMRQFTSYAVS